MAAQEDGRARIFQLSRRRRSLGPHTQQRDLSIRRLRRLADFTGNYNPHWKNTILRVRGAESETLGSVRTIL
jgi:hypothetical protein